MNPARDATECKIFGLIAGRIVSVIDPEYYTDLHYILLWVRRSEFIRTTRKSSIIQ